jgi:hypothetical protein
MTIPMTPSAIREAVQEARDTESTAGQVAKLMDIVAGMSVLLPVPDKLEDVERRELENFRRMYAQDQERTTERRQMMLNALGMTEGPGFEAILMVLCANHKMLREKQ